MSAEDTQSAIDTIRTYQRDIIATQISIKNLNQQIEDEVSSTSGYDDVRDAKLKLAEAEGRFKRNLAANTDYNNLLEERGQLSQKLKDQKEILSDHIVFLYKTTDERQVEVSDDGDAREIIVTGKLGKRGKYQQALPL